MGKISISLRKSAWLLALLIITSALPARAQSEFYDEFYDDLDYQEFLFKFDYRDDLNGYIVSPKKVDGQQWEEKEGYYLLEALDLVRLDDAGHALLVLGDRQLGAVQALSLIHI